MLKLLHFKQNLKYKIPPLQIENSTLVGNSPQLRTPVLNDQIIACSFAFF